MMKVLSTENCPISIISGMFIIFGKTIENKLNFTKKISIVLQTIVHYFLKVEGISIFRYFINFTHNILNYSQYFWLGEIIF